MGPWCLGVSGAECSCSQAQGPAAPGQQRPSLKAPRAERLARALPISAHGEVATAVCVVCSCGKSVEQTCPGLNIAYLPLPLEAEVRAASAGLSSSQHGAAVAGPEARPCWPEGEGWRGQWSWPWPHGRGLAPPGRQGAVARLSSCRQQKRLQDHAEAVSAALRGDRLGGHGGQGQPCWPPLPCLWAWEWHSH